VAKTNYTKAIILQSGRIFGYLFDWLKVEKEVFIQKSKYIVFWKENIETE